MDPALFLSDLHRKPASMRDLAVRLRSEDPWAFLSPDVDSVVLLGMGSSAYAGGVAAARMRARGVRAVCELASSDLQPQWGSGTTVVAISATGGSRETLAALEAHREATVVALTNTSASPMVERAAQVVDLAAGVEEGGVACRSFQHTLVLLAALEARLTGGSCSPLADVVDKAADASEHLLTTSDVWLPAVADLMAGPDGGHLAAPARRLSSAQQGALMLREGPRLPAVACEVGDWAHVDVYLTKNTDYRLLVFAGSRWDDGILEWTRPRGTTVVAVGGDFPEAALTVRYPHDDVDDVRLLTETLVPELVAAHLWSEAVE
jgi:glucosamine 6-phosphate synthetase-like amidotransferase/phosphosugar isomerase protein